MPGFAIDKIVTEICPTKVLAWNYSKQHTYSPVMLLLIFNHRPNPKYTIFPRRTVTSYTATINLIFKLLPDVSRRVATFI